MKAFWFSVIGLGLLCVAVLLNSLYVSKISNDMEKEALKIKDSPSIGRLEELEDIWDKSRLLVSISVPHKETDELEKGLLVLRARIESGSEHGTSEALELVLRAIYELKTHGTVSVDNVL